MKKIILVSIPVIIGILAFLFIPNQVENFEDVRTFEEIRVAFIGDQGGSKFLSNDKAVIELIKNENVELVIHQGDLGFEPASPEEWDKMITENLGSDFVYLVSEGHHDQESWDDYQPYLKERIERNSNIECKGNLGVKSICNYKDISVALIAPGEYTSDSDFDLYVEKELNKNESYWKICSMHNELHAMEAERKPGKTGMEVFEACKNAGAIIATGHDHLYSRTGNIIEFISSETRIADPESSELNKLKISKGSTFIFTSGLGGSPIINHNNDWPVNYSAKQNANYGGLFCTFNAGGQPNKAFCYFKDIDHKIIDEFTITSDLNEFSGNLNFINGDFSNSDFSNEDLSNKVLIDSIFKNVKFMNSDLSNSIFIGSNLSGADLSDTNLSGVSLSTTDLTGAKLTGADLSDTNLSGMDLSGMDLSGVKLTGADLSDTNLSGMDLSGMDLSGVKLRGMDLSGMDLSGVKLTGADLSDTNLSGMDLSGMDLSGVKLRGVDLSGVDLSGVKLTGADLSDTNLTGMDLSGMDLSGMKLTGADLTDVNLSGVSLSTTDVSGAKLTGADLTDVNLSGMDLTKVNFDMTDLSGKKISDSNFDFVSLKDTKMDNIDFSHTKMREVDLTKINNKDLSNSNLFRTSITYSNLKNIDISNTAISESNLHNSDLSKIDFTKIKDIFIQRVNFVNAKLVDANFSGMKFIEKNPDGLVKVEMSSPINNEIFKEIEGLGINDTQALLNYSNHDLTQLLWNANLYSVIVVDKKIIDGVLKIFYVSVVQFQYADLTNADFSNADLTYALFANTNLSGADLSEADLTQTILIGANLSGADLTQTILIGANLSGADLTGANLSGADLTGANLSGADLKCINHEICE